MENCRINFDPTASTEKAHLVAIHVAVKRANREMQTVTVRTPVLVSKLEHLHYTVSRLTVNFSRYSNSFPEKLKFSRESLSKHQKQKETYPNGTI